MRMPSSRNKSINLFDSDVLLPPLLIGSSFVGWEDEMVIALHHIVLKKKNIFSLSDFPPSSVTRFEHQNIRCFPTTVNKR